MDTKIPESKQFADVLLSGGTNNLARGTLDANMPLEIFGAPSAVRVNAMVNTNGVADRDVVRFSRVGFAPSLTMGLGTDTRLTLSYFYQSENDTTDFGEPWYFGAPRNSCLAILIMATAATV